MKSEQWYKKQKFRVRKKYTFLFGRYFSPRELRRHEKMIEQSWRVLYWEYRMAWRRMNDGDED